MEVMYLLQNGKQPKIQRKKDNVLLNNALNILYLWLYGPKYKNISTLVIPIIIILLWRDVNSDH